MTDSPLVSIVIPTYNRAGLLPRAIESVLKQTYGNLEIIVVDDGSTDNTPAVLQRYRNRIRMFRTENRGASHARNVGMREAFGKYLAFLDSDDSYYPWKLSLQVDWMERHPDIGMISSEISAVLDDGTFHERYLRRYHPLYAHRCWKFEDIYSDREDIFLPGLGTTVTYYSGNLFEFLVMGTLVMSPTILVRKEVADVVGYQNENYRYAEDYDFILRICKRYRVALVDVPTYRVYFHDGQISRFLTRKKCGRASDDLSKIEALEVVLAAVTATAYGDSEFYRAHRAEVDARLAELNAEIGDRWLKCGDLRKGRVYLRRSYEFQGKTFPLLRSCVAACFPERYKQWIRSMRRVLLPGAGLQG